MSATSLTSLETLAASIPDGALLAVPKDTSGVAMAATRELIRRGVRRLHLVCVPTSGLQADILIGAQVEPEGWAFADVFYDAQSPERVKPISRSLVCLNPAKRWKVGFDGDLKTYDLRYTLAHEIGHAIGLDHPAGAGQIMGYRYEERFRELQPGDVHGAKLLYGAPPSTDVAASPGDPDTAHQSRAAESLGTRALQSRSP